MIIYPDLELRKGRLVNLVATGWIVLSFMI
jgi:hypothetical protein